jgi:hypothetical protein
LILCAFSLQVSAKSVIFLHYWVNKAYIAQNLCEKKEIKNNACQGSCHLNKELKKQDEKEKTPVTPPNFKDLKEVLVFFETCTPQFGINPFSTTLLFFQPSNAEIQAGNGVHSPPPEKA